MLTAQACPVSWNSNLVMSHLFYFLTFEGKLAYSAPEEKLGNGNDELSSLFYAAHDVIGEIREIEQK